MVSCMVRCTVHMGVIRSFITRGCARISFRTSTYKLTRRRFVRVWLCAAPLPAHRIINRSLLHVPPSVEPPVVRISCLTTTVACPIPTDTHRPETCGLRENPVGPRCPLIWIIGGLGRGGRGNGLVSRSVHFWDLRFPSDLSRVCQWSGLDLYRFYMKTG